MGRNIRPIALVTLLAAVLAACGQTGNTPSGSTGASSSTGAGTSSSPSASSAASSASPSTAASASSSPTTAASRSASPSASASASSSPTARASTSPSASASTGGTVGGTTETETAETTETAGTGETAGAGAVALPAVDASEFAGQAIITAGSSTVGPLSEAMAERWAGEGGQAPTVDSVGTGGGFTRFCEAAETDIANASRPIEDDEREDCVANNREPIEFRVGTDALVVAVSAENDFVEELTIEQLALVFSDEVTGTATLWSDIDPSFPSEPIERFVPGTDSGTFDYFVEEVFDDESAAVLGAQNLQQSEDDNVLVQGIESSPNAIGFFGFAYYQEEQDQLKAIRVDGVEPNADTAENGEYPLARPLFIYSAAPILEEKPQVAAFINFYLTNVNDEIEDVGYFRASEEALNESRQALLDATGE